MSLPVLLLCFIVVLIGAQGRAQDEGPVPAEGKTPRPAVESADKEEEKGAEKSEPVVVAKPVVKQQYQVQSGDNLWKIAKAHGVDMRALLHENKLENSNNLQVGAILNLPKDVESKNPPPPETETPKKAVAASGEPDAEVSAEVEGWELYTIKSGDNPWKIAKTQGIEHQGIVKLNPGLDFTKLRIGQEIKIPKK